MLEDVDHQSTTGVTGQVTVDQALNRLLRGTGLRYEYVDDQTVTILPIALGTAGKPLTPSDAEHRTKDKLTSANSPGISAASSSVWGKFRVAQAESGPSSATLVAQADVAASGLPEVVVTAQRREENLQTVPVAVTAISAQILEENHINSVADLSYLVPGLAPPQGYAREIQWLTIRGQGVNATGIPGVVQYINEVPLPSSTTGISATGGGLYYDLENIQVLKGPQGTLFGRNTVGGAVLYQTKRPTRDLEGYLELGAGNYNEREFTGALNLPIISDTLAIRFAANGEQRDGYTKLYIYPMMRRGRSLDNQDYIAGRVSVAFQPTESFRNDLIVDFLHSHSDGTQRILTTNDALGPGFPTSDYPIQGEIFARQQQVGSRAQVDIYDDQYTKVQSTTVSNISQYNFSDQVKLRNILGYVDTRLHYTSEFGPWLFLVPQYDLRQFTEELQLQGQSLTDKLQWIVGVFYSDVPEPDNPAENYQCAFGPCVDGNGGASSNFTKSSAKSKAVYAQGTYDLSSWVSGLRLTTGLRYTWDDRGESAFRLSSGGDCLSPAPEGSGLACGTKGSGSFSAPTWTVNLEYQAAQNTLLYLASRRGYRSGGFNTDAGAPPYGPEYVTDVELGIKADWHLAEMPVRTNLAIYDQNYNDVQVEQYVFNPADPAVPYDATGNGGKARVWGAELEAMLHPTEALQFGAVASYLRWDFTDISPTVVDPEGLTRIPNYGLPRTQFGLNARYFIPIGAQMGNLSVGANYSWVEHMVNARPPTPGGDIPAYGFLNFNADWEHIANSSISVALYATNVTNELHNGNLQNGPGDSVYPLGLSFSLGQYDPPRMYGLRLRYTFDEKR